MDGVAFPLETCIVAAGTARADLAAIAAMRKRLPDWAPDGTAGHFLKHADEQTVVAVTAVDRAIASFAIDLEQQRQWAIVAAPRYVGRLAGVHVLDRFARGGGPAVSPHAIPQHSLHSISGALSVLLANRGPNFGVGGSCESLAEGLLAAVSLGGLCQTTGAWIVATAWDPEPTFGADGHLANEPVCYAFALAVQAAAAPAAFGKICLLGSAETATDRMATADSASVPQIVAALDAALVGRTGIRVVCPQLTGMAVSLEVRPAAARRAA